jgi:hypothetical protein
MDRPYQAKNSAADLSPTAGHMPRLLGRIGLKLFRQNPELAQIPKSAVTEMRWLLVLLVMVVHLRDISLKP